MALFALIAPVLAPAPAHAAPYAAIIMDARTGEELWSQNADTRLHPASLTKMMTLYITFQEIQAGRMSLDTVVTVSKHAAAQPPSRLGLKPGQKIKVRYLIRAAAIKSANDAAAALGDHIAGSEAAFASRMTRTARALGMRNTTFKNAHGLTAPGHLSTARDMTLLGRHLFYDFPQFYNIFSRRTADAGIAKVVNTNSRFLDGYEGADGIKTGYTVPAGFNLTASAKRGDKRIIATIFGGTSTPQRNAKMVELMNKGFSLAKNGVRERRPNAAGIQGADLLADAAPAAGSGNVEGGSAKTIRVSGAVLTSPRPKPRPERAAPEALVATATPVVPDALSAAIAEGVESALAEANAPPPPADTFEAQALALATPGEPVSGQALVDPAAVEEVVAALAEPGVAAPAPAPAGTLEAQAEAIAAVTPGSLEAQAAALAAGAAPAETPAPVETQAADMALAALRPMPRPDNLVPPAAAPVPADAPVIAEAAPGNEAPVAAPVYETVAPAEEILLAEAESLAPEVMSELPGPGAFAMDQGGSLTAVETVAADARAVIAEPEAPARRAPIFEPVSKTASAEAPVAVPAEELVVVSKSTSGGRGYGVAVGSYTSEYEAQRALLPTALAESAILDQGLRKVTQRGGKYRASFLGLTEEQAGLACRRLRARGMTCETMGPA